MTRRPGERGDGPPAGLPGRIVRAAAPELAALRARAARRTRRAVTAAAALLLAVPLLHGLWRGDAGPPAEVRPPSGAAGIRAEAAWLAASLRADGSFDPGNWSGPHGEDLAMHGLALLALARADTDADAAHREELLRGAGWLIERQAPDGSFDQTLGRCGTTAFGAPIATLALLEVGRLTREASVRAAAARAARALSVELRAGDHWAAVGGVLPPGVRAEGAAWCLLALQEAARGGAAESLPARTLARFEERIARAAGPDAIVAPPLPRLALGPTRSDDALSSLGPLHAASVAILAALPGQDAAAH